MLYIVWSVPTKYPNHLSIIFMSATLGNTETIDTSERTISVRTNYFKVSLDTDEGDNMDE